MSLTKEQSLSMYGTEAYTAWPEAAAFEDAKKKGIVDQNGQQTNPTSPSGGTAADTTIKDQMAETDKLIREQFDFVKDFLGKNPFAFDEALAKEVSTAKFKPYFEEQLSDFVNPLQEKISRSKEDATKVLGELVRRRELGETTRLNQIQTGLDRIRGGFAGRGLFGSGAASTVENQQEIAGKQDLADFSTTAKFNEDQTQTSAQREQADYNTAIEQKKRDILGTGRALDTSITSDIESQRGTALNKYKIRALESYTGRYGTPTAGNTSISDYLNLAVT